MSRSTRRPAAGVTHTHHSQPPASQQPVGPSLLSTTNPLAGQPVLTRRAALKTMLGLTVAGAAALGNPLRVLAEPEASQETTDALNAAQAQLDAAQAQLDAIADEYVALSQALNQTVSQMEGVQGQIDATQEQIDAKQAELDQKQEQLGSRISQSYKSGDSDFLSLLLNSTTFEELSSNLFYLGKINESDERLIGEVKQVKAERDAQKAELERQKAELEQLKAEQAEQLAAVTAKQNEATAIVNVFNFIKFLRKSFCKVLYTRKEPA